jgi:hypothetical protein
MRIALVLLTLPLGACAGAYHTSSDGRLQTKINDAYKARDACLSSNVSADSAMAVDAASVARTAAMACTAETEKLVDVSNRDGDPRVANRIRQDSEFRALGLVLRTRGQASN